MMRRFVALFLVTVVAAGASAARPDLNAFLNRKAETIEQVLAQVKTDSEVRARYERHFGMSGPEVLAYLSTLRKSQLSKDRIFKVYSVPPGGQIKVHVETYPAGSNVYVDIAGNPVMIVKCGNPLTQGPKDVVAEKDPDVRVREGEQALRDMEELDKAADLGRRDIMMFTPDAPSMPAVTTTSTQAAPIIPAAGIPLGNLLLGAIGLGTLGLISDDDSDSTPVPEPSAIAAFVVGASLLTRRRRR